MKRKINFILNNKNVSIEREGETRLLDVLREEFSLMGIKEGCGEGECGACSVLLNGKLINSCLIAVGSLDGQNILTIEGFRETEKYKILEKAFSDCGAVQCGFCTPGMIMAAESCLSKNPKPKPGETQADCDLRVNIFRTKISIDIGSM